MWTGLGNSLFKIFMYLFLAVLGLRCCIAFLFAANEGYPLVAVLRLPIAVASLVVEHRL